MTDLEEGKKVITTASQVTTWVERDEGKETI